MIDIARQSTEHEDLPPTRARRPALRLRRVVLGAVIGTVVAAVCWLIAVVIIFRDPLPTLTQARLDEAVERWHDHGPASYRLELSLSGNQVAHIQLEVQDGDVTEITYNGRPPRQRRVGEYWTVPSQFDMIQRELSGADDPQRGFGAPPDSTVVIKAEFDPAYGYPKRYRRHVLGTATEIAWTVTRFEPLP